MNVTVRHNLLARLNESLSSDDRFVAAWLTGSLGRNAADVWSDLDLTLVVADSTAQTLCQRPFQTAAHTTPERLALFSQFGHPALIHENNYNAPAGGTFTCVIYAESLVTIDWILQPYSSATRPGESRLLFSKQNVPLATDLPLEPLADRLARASEQTAFFWMMATITVKYIARSDSVFVNQLLEMLRDGVYEVDRLLNGEPRRFSRGARGPLAVTHDEQIQALRQLGAQMLSLGLQVENAGGETPTAPTDLIEKFLSFASV